MSQPRSKPETSQCMGQCSAHWATPARAYFLSVPNQSIYWKLSNLYILPRGKSSLKNKTHIQLFNIFSISGSPWQKIAHCFSCKYTPSKKLPTIWYHLSHNNRNQNIIVSCWIICFLLHYTTNPPSLLSLTSRKYFPNMMSFPHFYFPSPSQVHLPLVHVPL